MDKIFILFAMVFCHIFDDYYLQVGILSSLKQKEWWKKNEPNEMYKYDYLMALFIHSFSWTFMIMLVPCLVYSIFPITLFIFNLVVHFSVDNQKANLRSINLIQDQCIHLLQIVITWLFLVYLAP